LVSRKDKISSSIAMPITKYGWSRTTAKEPEILPIMSECSNKGLAPLTAQDRGEASLNGQG